VSPGLWRGLSHANMANSYIWSEGQVRSTMKSSKSYIESEDGSQLNWSENGNSMYAIVNRDAPNQFGESPGYRFMPAAQIARFTIKDSTVTKKGITASDHHFFVTKQKDTEARSTHPYNLMNNVLNPEEPVVEFDKFFDGDSLKQEDL
jgi:primary-amine oxidase